MDTLQVVSGLEAYYVTLKAEVDEINRDMQHCQAMNSKYGKFWSPGLHSLTQLKAVKEQQVSWRPVVLQSAPFLSRRRTPLRPAKTPCSSRISAFSSTCSTFT